MLMQDLFGIIQKSEPSDIPYSLNQFLGWDFFRRFLQQTGSNDFLVTMENQKSTFFFHADTKRSAPFLTK